MKKIKFSTTIDQGTAIIEQYVEELKADGKTVLSGEKAFKLHDTYGFPLELTQEMLEENGCSVDIDGFNEHMNQQKETARAARKSAEEDGWAEDNLSVNMEGVTIFTGYEKVVDQGTVKSNSFCKTKCDSCSRRRRGKNILRPNAFLC